MRSPQIDRQIDVHKDVIRPLKEASEYLVKTLDKGWAEKSLRDRITNGELTAGIHYATAGNGSGYCVNCSRVIEWHFAQCRGE